MTHTLSITQLAFLVNWANAHVNYSVSLAEQAHCNDEEAILRSLPDEYQDGERLLDLIPWGSVERITAIVTDQYVAKGRDMHKGTPIYAAHDDQEIAELAVRYYGSDWTEQDYETITGEICEVTDNNDRLDAYNATIQYEWEDNPDFMAAVFLDPHSQMTGKKVEFLGYDIYVDEHNRVYIPMNGEYLDEEPTCVLYRWWKDEVIAIFPFVHASPTGCASYQHIGQHGGCNPDIICQQSRAATEEEYTDLNRELEGLGYNLVIL